VEKNLHHPKSTSQPRGRLPATKTILNKIILRKNPMGVKKVGGYQYLGERKERISKFMKYLSKPEKWFFGKEGTPQKKRKKNPGGTGQGVWWGGRQQERFPMSQPFRWDSSVGGGKLKDALGVKT